MGLEEVKDVVLPRKPKAVGSLVDFEAEELGREAEVFHLELGE